MSKKTSVHDVGDRKYTGTTATVLFKSRQEAPEVSDYNYENVEVQPSGNGYTDMNDFGNQWTTTLFGGISNVQAPTVTPDVLLNDALMCVRIDDGIRLLQCLEKLRDIHGYQYPADVPFGELFQESLWDRISDPEFKISEEQREITLEVLKYFHAVPETNQ